MFIYSNDAAKPHSCGDTDLRNIFPVVVSRRDNVNTKDSSQTFISEDLCWDIVFPTTVTYCLSIYFLNVPK